MKAKKNIKKRNYNDITNNNDIIENNNIIKKLPLPKISYDIIISKELEINKLNKSSKYITIDLDKLKEHIIENTINIYITKFNNWKGLIPKNFFYETKITKDGNCLLRAVSKYFLGEENKHLYFRNIIYNYISLNKNDEMFTSDYIHDNNKILDIENYLKNIKLNGFFVEN